jgi:hypothetical protein
MPSSNSDRDNHIMIRKSLDSIYSILWEPELPYERFQTQDFSSIRLPVQGMAYYQRCFKADKKPKMSSGIGRRASFTV